jgi:ubiquinone/menaquinone biosynthesis C-methylase UbiE
VAPENSIERFSQMKNTDNALNRETLIQRAMSVLRSRRLKCFRGTDVTEIERKVTAYYASHSGGDYYARLAEQHLWDDMIRRKNFESYCQTANDILDFGCGAGGLTVALAEHFPDKRIHAIDIGAHAAALISSSTATIDFRQGSVLDAPFAGDSIDMLISRFVIEHTIHPDKLISEAHRILKPNGIFYLLYPQLLLKVTFPTAFREVLSWIFNPSQLTYLDPQIGATTSDADDQDAVWLTNPVKIATLLKRSGFKIISHVPTQSLVIARKS